MSKPKRRSLHYLIITLKALIALFLIAALVALSSRPAYADKWALLIGIDEYSDKNRINNLGAAAADARALKATLIEAAGFPEANVHLLVSDADPSRGERTPAYNTILRELATLTQEVKPGDTVLILYSGHGIEISGKTYLLPYDTDAFDESTLTDTAIEVGKFRERLQQVKAGTLILAFDMCRTNPRKGAKDIATPNKLTQGHIRGLDFSQVANAGSGRASSPSTPVVVTLYACSPDQQSFEWNEKGRGYFSYYLEQGLRGEAADGTGAVHFDRLAEYVASHVEQSVQRGEGKQQSPFYEFKGSAGSASDLVLATGVFPVAAPVVSTATDAVAVDTNAMFRMIVSPTGAIVSVDGTPLDGKYARINLGVDQSRTVTLRAEAPGCLPLERLITVKRGLNAPVVMMLEGTAAALDAASAPVPTAAAALPPPDDMTSQLMVTADGGARATFRRDEALSDGGAAGEGNMLTVRTTAIASADWRVRAVCRTSILHEGSTYEIRFRARADAPQDITVSCQTADGDGHNIGLKKTFVLGTEWQEYHLPFRATHISRSTNFAPIFSLGSQVGTVHIAGFTLIPAAE